MVELNTTMVDRMVMCVKGMEINGLQMILPSIMTKLLIYSSDILTETAKAVVKPVVKYLNLNAH